MTKVCKKCQEDKDLDQFYARKDNKDHKSSICKDCYNSKDGRKSRTSLLLQSDYFTKANLHRLAQNCTRRGVFYDREGDLTALKLFPLLEEFCKNNKYSWEPRSPWKPSVDRIDNSKGYTMDNIQIVWMIENLCKSTFTNEEVIEFCKRKLQLLH